MRDLNGRWLMTVRDKATISDGESPRRGWALAVLSGCALGVIATLVVRALGPALAPLGILIVIVSTLVAGRVAWLGPALAHGACAWVSIITTAALTRAPLKPWHGIPAMWILFVLIEDMALLGHLGRRRRLDE